MTHHPTPMSPYTGQHMQMYPQTPAYRSEWQTLLDAGKTGAVVGTAGAAAMNLHRMRRDGTSLQTALRSTVQAGVNAGIATAAATAVSRMFGHNPTLALAATLTTGTAVMYALTSRGREHANA